MSYKQSKRRDDDITIVNMALNTIFETGTDTIKKLDISFGGVAPVTVLAHKTCKSMVGRYELEQQSVKISFITR